MKKLKFLRKNPYKKETCEFSVGFTFRAKREMEAAGFTLIELLLVVSLIAISVGVTGDVITSLIRSYTKTQVQNEIEQNANFASFKLEKEVRNASYTTFPAANGGGNTTLRFVNRDGTNLICYRVRTVSGVGILERGTSANLAVADCSNYSAVTNSANIGGVNVTCNVIVPGNNCFSVTQAAGGPFVVRVHLEFAQVGGGSAALTGNVVFDNTLVVRGSY